MNTATTELAGRHQCKGYCVMKTRFKYARGALAGCAALWLLAGGQAQAQQPRSYDLDAITRRLEQQEAELQALRAKVNNLPERLPSVDGATGPDGSLLHTSSFNADGDKKKDSKKDEEKLPEGMKKAEIVTKPTYKIFGRILADNYLVDQDDLHRATYGDGLNRTRFKTIRIGVEGDVYENVSYKFEIAFMEKEANTDRPVAKDVYLEIKDQAYFNTTRIGHFKEPYSLDQLTSNRFITFMERSLADVFAPGRNMGLMMYDHVFEDETLSWYTGIFRPEIDDDAVDENEDTGDFSWTSRLAWNPYYDEPSEGRYLTHIGGSYSYREIGDQTYSFQKDPELNIRISEASALNVLSIVPVVDNVQLANIEAAVIYGPFHAQSEWFHASIEGAGAGPDGDFNGVYAQCGYFLTGESRGYKKSSHAFDRTKILEPFFAVHTSDGVCCGRGAWELKARYSYVDLNDTGLTGGRVEDFSTGVNWYLNSYTRMMFDYIHTQTEAAPTTALFGGEADLFGMRAQIDW